MGDSLLTTCEEQLSDLMTDEKEERGTSEDTQDSSWSPGVAVRKLREQIQGR